MQHALWFVLTLTLGLVAQERQPVLLRATDVFVLHVDGPARLRSAFLATNVGTLLESQEVAGVWTSLQRVLDGGLDEFDEHDDLDDLLGVLHGYTGRITVAGTLVQPSADSGAVTPELGFVVVAEGDHSFDLDAVGERIREHLARSATPTETLEVGEHRLTLVPISERGGYTLPIRLGDRVVAFAAANVRAFTADRLTATAAPFEPDDELRTAPCALRVDLRQLVELGKQDRSFTASSVSPDDIAAVTGLASLGELRVTIRPRGPHVALETSVSFAPGVPRGFFAGFLPDTIGAPTLAALIPPSAPHWHAGKMRVDLLARALRESIATWLRQPEETLDQATERVRGMEREFIGTNLETEVFAHLNGEFALLGSLLGAAEGTQVDAPAALGEASGTVLFAFGIADHAKFTAGWKTVVETSGAFGREVGEVIAGTTVHSDRWTAWAVTDDTFLIGFGEDAEPWLAQVLQHRARVLVDSSRKPGSLPRDVERRLRFAPEGLQGVGAFDVRSLLGLPVFELFDLDEEVGAFAGDGWAEVFAELRPILAEYGLERAFGYAGWADDRWTWRVLW